MALSKIKVANLERLEVPDPEPTVASWNDLPPEVAEKILEKLGKDQLTFLPYRLVNWGWRSLIDSILERRCLAEFLKWIAHFPHPDFQPVPKITNMVSYFVSQLEDNPRTVNCPPNAFLKYCGNPFPSSSLLLTESLLSRNSSPYDCKLVMDFIAGFGHYLTSLFLDRMTIEPDNLIKILMQTPNLKALRLANLQLHVKNLTDPSLMLPALKNLATLQLSDNGVSCDWRWPIGIKFFTTLLESYGPQLVHLEIDQTFTGNVPPLTWPSPNLKMMKVFEPTQNFLLETGPAPVEYLSVIKISQFGAGNIYDVVDFLHKFANTLVELHLDILWHTMMMGNLESKEDLAFITVDKDFPPEADPWKLIHEDECMNSMVEKGGKLNTSSKMFPHLKKLAISYPREEIDVVLVKETFLLMFPALKKLEFLWFKGMPWWYKWDTGYHTEEKNIECFLQGQNYWDICPELQTILVVAGGNPNEEVLYVVHK